MTRRSEFLADERGTTFALGYIIDIMIMGLLLTGIIFGVTTMLQSQHDRSVHYQADIIGSQVSYSVTTIDNLDNHEQRTNTTLSVDTPDRIIGSQYIVELNKPPSENPHIAVHIPSSDITETTPVSVDATVVESSVTGDDVHIKYVDEPGEEPTITLVGDGDGS